MTQAEAIRKLAYLLYHHGSTERWAKLLDIIEAKFEDEYPARPMDPPPRRTSHQDEHFNGTCPTCGQKCWCSHLTKEPDHFNNIHSTNCRCYGVRRQAFADAEAELLKYVGVPGSFGAQAKFFAEIIAAKAKEARKAK